MQIKEIYTQITQSMPNYRARNSQAQMVAEIDTCFSNVNSELNNGQNICLIEAPTGTGKSLAYLIAGVVNAKALGKKLIVTTATKTLQSQLVEKDIPNFSKFSKINFSYALAKGRGNYLCPYQAELNLQELSGDLLAESSKLKEDLDDLLRFYANKTWDGDLDRTPIAFEAKLKPLITTDKDRCLAYSCPYNQKDECNCPFYNNREKLKSCDVIVTNHSLLLSDITLGAGSVLPTKPNDYLLCVDEGHNFADIAVNSFTGMFELKQVIGNCQNLSKLIYNPQTQSYLFTDIPLSDELFDKTGELISLLDEFLFLLTENTHLFNDGRLILNDYLNVGLSHEFRDRFVNFAFVSSEIYAGLTSINDKLKEQLRANPDYMVEANLNKLGFYLGVIESIMLVSQYIINQDDSRYNANAKWIEIKTLKSGADFAICAGLTHVGNILFNKLWSKVYAAVITSATLAVGQDFRYYLHKLGLNLFPEVGTCKLPTGFMYREQAQIVVPRFKTAPEFTTRDQFTRELVEYLTKTLDYEESYGTLVLFFNRNQLQEAYAALPKLLQKRILLQTDYLSSQRLINEHKILIDKGKPSIIFGLNSFAEGVDLPSLYCMHVIITKLPFDTHKDPQNMVQEYWIKFEKGSYFSEVSLPEACIRLIQAAGRLIRNEDDYGQVSICDNRLVTKPYGTLLLNALPDFNRKYNPNFLLEAFDKVGLTHG